jgi:hypothetical protein
VPGFAPKLKDRIFLRKDMRFGPDDPTLWPQEYSSLYCHLGAIPRKPTTTLGKKSDLAIMWWNPERTDFVSPQNARSVTRGLGKLNPKQLAHLVRPIDVLIEQCTAYCNTFTAPAKPNKLFPAMMLTIRRGVERLQTLPCTYDQMVISVTKLQRGFLELTGLLRYMTVYLPRMNDLNAVPGTPDACMGVFTWDGTIAQQFHDASLPYWYIRPLAAFTVANIHRVVVPSDPLYALEVDPAPGYESGVEAGEKLDDRIGCLYGCTEAVSWYRNAFSGTDATPTSITNPAPTTASSAVTSSPEPVAGPSRLPASRPPANRPANHVASTSKNKSQKAQRPHPCK